MASSIGSRSSDSIFAPLDISSTLVANNDIDNEFEAESDAKSKFEPEANNISRELSEGDLEEEGNVQTEEERSPVFTLFPKLPPELRNKIWKKACFVPRVIGLWCFPIGDENLESFCNDNFDEFPWA
jgi:hypothetical protein